MSSYQFTPQAVDDLFEIWSYIAGDERGVHQLEQNRQVYSVEAANALIQSLSCNQPGRLRTPGASCFASQEQLDYKLLVNL